MLKSPNGFPVVLTADRTLTAGYRLLFDGMLAASQTSAVPPALLAGLLMPRGKGGRAPLGLRRIEAALLEGGFSPAEVAFTADDGLAEAIGPATRVIGVSAGEPTGAGMNSNTMTGIAGGRIYPEVMFRKLMDQIRRQTGRATRGGAAPRPRVVMGGPGAWQLARAPEARAALGIDHIVTGYAEGNAAEIFRALLEGAELPPVIEGRPATAGRIPPIRHPSTMGAAEISRGCGLGCRFCTIGAVPMLHLPPETILADVRTNLAGGARNIALLSEDFFRYGAQGIKTHPEALLGLLRQIRQTPGLGLIQIDHVNISSVAQFNDTQLLAIRELLEGPRPSGYPWVNVGIETAAGELLALNGGSPKMGRHRTQEWGEFCAAHLRRLVRAGFLPMASLILGLPGEKERDVEHTLEWVRSLHRERITVFPMLYAPIDGSGAPSTATLKPAHWRLIRECYRLNFKWVPRMYWHSQRAAGVPLARRLLLQMMGRGQVLQWNVLFALKSWKAR